MISALVFLFAGGGFVYSLLSGLFKLMNYDFGKDGLTGSTIFSIFKLGIICLVVLILFIMFGIPFLEANGYE